MRLFVLLTCLTCPEIAWAQENPGQPASVITSQAANELLAPYLAEAQEKWEKSIRQLEQLDQATADPADAILFIGSSSIRRWDTIATDMAPFRTIRRGYGGAKFTDLAVYAQRLIQPHQYRALVIFVGNGVTTAADSHTPDQIEPLVRYVVDFSHRHQPAAPVFIVEITPTESRFNVWSKIRAVNARLREIALTKPDTYFIATASRYLRPNAMPRSELFVEDKLHLNAAGYDLWASIIRRRLDEVLRQTARGEGL